MGTAWGSFNQLPDHRHRNRRSALSTSKMRQAFDGSPLAEAELAPDQRQRQRDRRSAFRESRNRSSRTVSELLIAVGLILLLALLVMSVWNYIS